MIVIGGGRIGGALTTLAKTQGAPVHLITRHQGWQALDTVPGPIFVATRNDALDAVLAKVPGDRRGDLVLVQNGMLRPWLAERGLEGLTRGLLFFAVSARGDAPTPGVDSPFSGPHAEAVAAWLSGLGLGAAAVTREAFAEVELEKLVWNSAFGLLCEACDASVGVVVRAHTALSEALHAELVAVGQAALGTRTSAADITTRNHAYSLSIEAYRGAVKAWRWRNGWFVAAAREHGVATPVHDRLLAQVGAADRF